MSSPLVRMVGASPALMTFVPTVPWIPSTITGRSFAILWMDFVWIC